MRTFGIVVTIITASFAIGCGAGTKGDPGADGPAGPTGPTGVMGTSGPSGPMGPSGVVGPTGTPGPTGDPGTMGPTGTQGPTGPIDATAPSKPAGLYLTAGDSSHSTLHWNVPSGGVAIDYFIVYSSTQAIAGNKAAASQEAVAAASHKDSVLLEANSGVQHLAVSAVSYTGVEGPLSSELVVDTTSRLAVRSTVKTAGIDQLQVLSAGGSAVANPLGSGPVLNCTSGSPGCTTGQFTSGKAVDAIFWSPMGTQIAYVGHINGSTPELWMVAADGQSPVFNVSGPIVASGAVKTAVGQAPAFSPDGSAIAFVGDLAVHNVIELWAAPAAPAANPQPVRLNTSFGTDTAKGVTAFEWSPDGSMIAYIGTQGGLPELYVVPAAGGTNTKVSGTLTGGSSGVSGMAWSPDGTRLAFVADADTAGLPELYVVGAGGGAVTKVSGTMVGGSTGVLDNFEGVPFRWAPAGDRLAFLATKDDASTTELYVVGPAGGAVTRVSGQVPIGDAVSEYAWSPDGSQLAFILFDAVNTGVNIDVFLANAGGGPTVASGVGNATKDVDLLLWSLGGELGFRVDRDGAGHYDLEVAAGINMSNLLDVVTPAAPFANTNYAVNASRTPPTWSPEGGRVAFLADADAANVFSLFVAVPRGVLLRLSDAPATRPVDNFAWSPLGFSR